MSLNKISIWGLHVLLAGNLENTTIYEKVLSKIHLGVDGDGKILDHQVDNIKISLKVAMRLSLKKDNALAPKLRRALITLLDYGTELSSNNIRDFLASPESERPLLYTCKPANDGENMMECLFLDVIGAPENRNHQNTLDSLNAVMRQCKQGFAG